MSHSSASDKQESSPSKRFWQLDGWRGISILAVLAAHLVPLGPQWLGGNETAAALGMSLFFTLSGFLIATNLLSDSRPLPFLVRRLCRIMPLAYLFIVITHLFWHADFLTWICNILYLENYIHSALHNYNSHFWSLCVEVHFYLSAALSVMLIGRRGLFVLPCAAIAVTGFRLYSGTTISILTHLRVDEILAGATMALVWTRNPNTMKLSNFFQSFAFLVACLILVAASHPDSGPLRYFRPYAGAIAVGSSLYLPDSPIVGVLRNSILFYLARISFALYVIHGPLRTEWFAEGGTVIKYLVKRPITIMLTLLLAEISTRYWEQPWIEFGRQFNQRWFPKAKSSHVAEPAQMR